MLRSNAAQIEDFIKVITIVFGAEVEQIDAKHLHHKRRKLLVRSIIIVIVLCAFSSYITEKPVTIRSACKPS